MNNTTHTPGPLRVEGTHFVDDIAQEPLLHAVIRDSTERWVALVEITDDEGQANAHLIAAAPAMYEALVKTMKVLCSLRDSKEEWYTLVTPELLTAWDMNKAALSQAEGRDK